MRIKMYAVIVIFYSTSTAAVVLEVLLWSRHVRRKIKGYVTVYLSLILGAIIVFVTTVIEASRRQTIRFETECVTDAAINSIFAEYHRVMCSRYGLLFIDDSYGGVGDVEYTKSHLLRYMNMNFDKNALDYAFYDLTGIHADNATLSQVSFASDDEGKVLRYQVVRYMKQKTGIGLLDREVYNPIDIEACESSFEEYKQQREALDARIDEYVAEYNASKPEDEEVYDISNPADAVEKSPGMGVLYYAFGDDGTLSSKSVDLDRFISHRGYVSGAGLYRTQDDPYSVDDVLMFHQYMNERLGYRDKVLPDCALDYQLEYILEGMDNDIENLERVLEKIFVVRYVTNITYLHSDAGKKNEAKLLAAAVCTVLQNSELTDLVAESLLLAWAYAESAQDLRILFDGHKLGAVKSDSDWNVSLIEILDFKGNLSTYKVPTEGIFGYQEFLRGFLLAGDGPTYNMRLMDIMEMDIRLTSGNSNFRMDNMIYQLNMKANISSKFGYGYSIERGYSYN